MSELTQAVEDLQGAVGAVAARVGQVVTDLNTAVAAGVEALAAANVADQMDDDAFRATIADLQAALEAANTAAQSAAATIEANVSQLNTIAAPTPVTEEPAPPVEETPPGDATPPGDTTPPADGAPADGTAPVEEAPPADAAQA